MTSSHSALPGSRLITAWTLTTGEDGMRAQARGLAQAVADVVEEKTATAGPLAWLGVARLPPDLSAPWPDLVISCGRRSVGQALAVRAASGGRTLAVHVQDPRGRAGAFDLVVAMGHDQIAAGSQVIKTATALHDLTPQSLREAAEAWRGRLEPLGRPLVGVAIGGDLKGRPFTLEDGRRLLEALRRMRAGLGGGLAITPSRRTPPVVLALFAEAFAGDRTALVWDRQGENPYRGILGSADRLIVTSDSVSMISEALGAYAPVEIFDLGFRRHVEFIARLETQGLIRRFTGDPAPPTTTGPVNATQEAAAAVKALIEARRAPV